MQSDNYQQLDADVLLRDVIQGQFNGTFLFPVEPEEEPQVASSGNAYKRPAFTVADMPNTFIDMNRSFEYVGDNSTFQKRITWILSVQWIAFTFMVMGMTYIYRSPKFWCRDASGKEYVCPQDIGCHSDARPEFPSQRSLIEEFDLICQKEYLVTTAQSVFFAGGLVSGYILSYLSDRLGRRLMLIVTMAMAAAAIITCALAQSFGVFITGYFFLGFSMFGYETQVYGYISEISAVRFRAVSLNILMIAWAGAPIFFPLMNFLPSWRYLFGSMAVPMIASLPFMYMCFLESPRFLVSKGYFKQARKIFREISITNRRPPYEFRLIEEMEYENNTLTHINSDGDRQRKQLLNDCKKKKRQYNYCDLFGYRSLRRITANLMVLWLVRFFMYFSINLALQGIVNTGFLLSVVVSLSALSEVLGSFGIPVMTTYFFHKKKIHVMRNSLLVATICCALLWFVIIPRTCRVARDTCFEMLISILLIMLIKFFITTFYAGLQSYTPEIYPTDVRSLGLGFVLTLGRLGTIIVPTYINYMKVHYYDKNPLSFLAPWTLLATFLCWRMPDTETEGLKEHVDEERPSNILRQTELTPLNRNYSAGRL